MAAAAAAATRAARKEGSIADIFTSLTDESHISLPERFVDVKRGLWNDGLVESWRQVLEALEPAVENISAKGTDVWLLFFFVESNIDHFALDRSSRQLCRTDLWAFARQDKFHQTDRHRSRYRCC